MKKATNPKNRGKVSKLFPIMQEHLGQSMNLARIKLSFIIYSNSPTDIHMLVGLNY